MLDYKKEIPLLDFALLMVPSAWYWNGSFRPLKTSLKDWSGDPN